MKLLLSTLIATSLMSYDITCQYNEERWYAKPSVITYRTPTTFTIKQEDSIQLDDIVFRWHSYTDDGRPTYAYYGQIDKLLFIGDTNILLKEYIDNKYTHSYLYKQCKEQ